MPKKIERLRQFLSLNGKHPFISQGTNREDRSRTSFITNARAIPDGGSRIRWRTLNKISAGNSDIAFRDLIYLAVPSISLTRDNRVHVRRRSHVAGIDESVIIVTSVPSTWNYSDITRHAVVRPSLQWL